MLAPLLFIWWFATPDVLTLRDKEAVHVVPFTLQAPLKADLKVMVQTLD